MRKPKPLLDNTFTWFINPNPADHIVPFSLDSYSFQINLYALLKNLISKSVIWGLLEPIIHHGSQNSSLIFKEKCRKFIVGKGMNEHSLKSLLHVACIIMSYFKKKNRREQKDTVGRGEPCEIQWQEVARTRMQNTEQRLWALGLLSLPFLNHMNALIHLANSHLRLWKLVT